MCIFDAPRARDFIFPPGPSFTPPPPTLLEGHLGVDGGWV